MASTHANLLIHVVFSTKNREARISSDDQSDLYAYLGGIVRSRPRAALRPFRAWGWWVARYPGLKPGAPNLRAVGA